MSGNANATLIWTIAELLRGDYKQSEYGKIILPFTLLRRLDCVLAPTQAQVWHTLEQHEHAGFAPEALDYLLAQASGLKFYNISQLNFERLLADSTNIRANLGEYLERFSENVRDIFTRYEFDKQLDKLAGANLLYQVVQKFAAIDLSPARVSHADMGLMFEELIRRFAELSNETAGEHYTPREVIRLMVDLLFYADDDALSKPAIVRTLYDPTAGTGGMLSIAEDVLHERNPSAVLRVYGQELNDESYAICKADMLIKGQDIGNIACGNTLSHDAHRGQRFDYMLSNPPFGVEWKKVEKAVRKEHDERGFDGRFGPGLPTVADGSLLFLMHLISKMKPVEQGGSRIGIVLNGSPLFTGGAGSGESSIRQYVLENDLLEAIIALPTKMFYNTGIATYVWVLTNKKPAERRGKVQLINAAEWGQKMRKSLGEKRKELRPDDIERIVRLYGKFEVGEHSKIFDNAAFGYRTVPVKRPLRVAYRVSSAVSEVLCAALEPQLTVQTSTLRHALAALEDQTFLTLAGFSGALREALSAAPQEGTLLLGKLSLSPKQLGELAKAFEVRHPEGEVVTKKGKPQPDPELRDTENVPLKEDLQAYFEREVLPHVPDAWMDEAKTKVGYEIPFTRHFYRYTPPRALEEIDAELRALSGDISKMLAELTA